MTGPKQVDPLDITWQDRANCIGADPDLFFPPRGNAGLQMLRQARQLCAACEVREECLEYAVANHESSGVWAGLSGRQLRAERTRRYRLGRAS